MTVEFLNTRTQLLDALARFEQTAASYQAAREEHLEVEAEMNTARAAHLDAVYTEVADDPQAKVRWSNQDRKEREANLRLEQQHPGLVRRERDAAQAKRIASDERDRAELALKTLTAVLRYDTAQAELDAVHLQASQPRLVRR